MNDNTNELASAVLASPESTGRLVNGFIEKIEKYYPLKKNWDDATLMHKKKLNRDGQSYELFRQSLYTLLFELVEAERNGWVRMVDGPPPVGAHVQLWFTDTDGIDTICMQATLFNEKHTVMQAVAVHGEIEFKHIMYWKLITVPSGGVMEPIEVIADGHFDESKDLIKNLA